jgi:hypothetical protein
VPFRSKSSQHTGYKLVPVPSPIFTGIVGNYYTDDGTHTFDATNLSNKFLTRTDQSLSMDWGTGSPVPGGPTDNFIARWTGWFKAPVTDGYTFGAASDDGVKVYTNGNLTTPIVNAWSDHGNTPINYAIGQPTSSTLMPATWCKSPSIITSILGQPLLPSTCAKTVSTPVATQLISRYPQAHCTPKHKSCPMGGTLASTPTAT